MQHGRRANAESGRGGPNLAAPGARVAASSRQRPVARWRNQTTIAAPLGATAEAAKSARAPRGESGVDGPTRPPAPKAAARTLRPRCRTMTPLPSAATPASTGRPSAPARSSTRDGPKAAPRAAERRRTGESVPESGRALGLTTNARPSRPTATAALTSRGATTCAAGAFAGAAAAASSAARPHRHARVGSTLAKHLAALAGCGAEAGDPRPQSIIDCARAAA